MHCICGKQSHKGDGGLGGIQTDPFCHQLQHPGESKSATGSPGNASTHRGPPQRQSAHTSPCLPSSGRHPSNKERTLGRAKEFIPFTQAKPLPPCLFPAVSLRACWPLRAGTISPRMFGQQLHLILFGLLHPLQQKRQRPCQPHTGFHCFFCKKHPATGAGRHWQELISASNMLSAMLL